MKINIHLIILIGFIFRLGIAIWNGFFGPSFGADADAVRFHQTAVFLSKNLSEAEFTIGWVYSVFLAGVYYLIGDSLFIGSLLSCLAWLISAIFLLKITQILKIEKKNTRWILLIYALLPSSVMYTSVTLREAYQLLFVTLAVYAALKIIIGNSKSHWFLLIFSLIGASVLHGALMAFSILFLSFTVLMKVIKNKKRVPLLKITLVSPILILIMLLGFSFFSENAYQLEGGLYAAVQSYQEGAMTVDARAHYRTELAISGLVGLISFAPVSLFQYLFEPMPWKISSVVDVPLFFENILRFWLIYLSIKHLRKNRDYPYRRPLFFIFFSYLLIETIWSLGTINWGTASRHHVPSIGLLLLTAFATRGIREYKKKSFTSSILAVRF